MGSQRLSRTNLQFWRPPPRAFLVTRWRRWQQVRSEFAELVAETEYPVIVRPVGTHAGKAMERIASQAELAGYLKNHHETQYYLAPFIDYSGPDGKSENNKSHSSMGRPLQVTSRFPIIGWCII